MECRKCFKTAKVINLTFKPSGTNFNDTGIVFDECEINGVVEYTLPLCKECFDSFVKMLEAWYVPKHSEVIISNGRVLEGATRLESMINGDK